MAGWFVVGRLADRRETRKELREHMTELKARAVSLRSAAQEYWLKPASKSAPIAASVLKAEVSSLVRQSRVIRQYGLEFDDELLVNIRQAATGGEFEKANRRRSEADEQRVSQLMGYLEDLHGAVDEAFYVEFRAPKRRRWLRAAPMIFLGILSADSHGL